MNENYNLKQLIIITFIIVAILLIFYGITIVVTEKQTLEKENNSTTEDVEINYETILVQDIYKQKEDAYYVLASLIDDTNVLSYQSSISEYKTKEDALKIYEIDLSSAFNKKYMSTESNFEGNYPIFKETTLLKIENKKIKDVYEGNEDITTILEILTSEE